MDRRVFLGTALGAVVGTSSAFLPLQSAIGSYVLHADVPNGNHRLYPRKVLVQTVAWFKKLPPRTFMGQIGMPDSCAIQLAKLSHVVTKMELRGDLLYAELEILKTPEGQLLREKMSHGPGITFRTAGFGSVKVNDQGIAVVQEGFKLLGIHAVPMDKAARL